MGIIDKVKEVMHTPTTSSTDNTHGTTTRDETSHTSGTFTSNVGGSAHSTDFQDARARRRAEESAAALAGSHNNHTDLNRSGTAATTTSSHASSINSQGVSHTEAVPHSNRADYADVPGHSRSTKDTDINPLGPNTTNTTTTLNPVTNEVVTRNEIEDVQRIRDQERVITHVQLHEQPVLDRQVNAATHQTNVVKPTQIIERHAPAAGETQLLQEQVSQFRDTHVEGPTTHTIVDKGEIVNESKRHIIHNVVQPVIQREIVDTERIQTTIPIQETIIQAPIVHQSSVHEPMTMAAFTAAGGVLDSGVTRQSIVNKVMSQDNCERTVDGPAETMLEKLHLTSSHHSHASAVNNDASINNSTKPGL